MPNLEEGKKRACNRRLGWAGGWGREKVRQLWGDKVSMGIPSCQHEKSEGGVGQEMSAGEGREELGEQAMRGRLDAFECGLSTVWPVVL